MTPADLRAARKLLGMSQKELGRQLGITDRTVRRLEAGTSPIHERTEARIKELMRERELVLRALAGEE